MQRTCTGGRLWWLQWSQLHWKTSKIEVCGTCAYAVASPRTTPSISCTFFPKCYKTHDHLSVCLSLCLSLSLSLSLLPHLLTQSVYSCFVKLWFTQIRTLARPFWGTITCSICWCRVRVWGYESLFLMFWTFWLGEVAWSWPHSDSRKQKLLII